MLSLLTSPGRYSLFLKNEYFLLMNIRDFKKMNISLNEYSGFLKKRIFVLNEISGPL